MIKNVKCFGIGSNSFGKLNTVSFGIKTDNKWIIIDCGPDTPRQLYSSKIKFSDVNNIIITHSHMDHILGLPYLLFGRKLELMPKIKNKEETPSINIITLNETYNIVMNTLKSMHPELAILGYQVNLIEASNLNNYDLPTTDIKISTIKTDHEVDSFGIKIFDKKISFAYTSDSRPIDDFVEFAKGCDIVVLEGMVPDNDKQFATKTKHATVIEAGEMAKKINCKQTFMVHLRPAYLGDIEKLEKEASKKAGFNIRYPKEGEDLFLG